MPGEGSDIVKGVFSIAGQWYKFYKSSEERKRDLKAKLLVDTLFVVVFFVNLFIYLFFAALGLHYCAQAFSSYDQWGISSLWCAGFSLQWLLLLRSTSSRLTGSVVVAHGL